MTTPSDDAAKPVPVRVVLPTDPVLGHSEQEAVARLWRRRQTETGWLYLVGLPSYRDREDGGVEAAEYGYGCAPRRRGAGQLPPHST
ncbi:hypothetical protein GCM10010339_82300 [Streptomyces alanosinicus]|uniref:Uncharacterized protein n=1 Tax=Streptomyces alanosinicus TaxID=68171 RepID=A0A918YU07_9ACTN|nr:hypothetical protein GCM10010339_82300 [Streptomyces alanosinicus]